MDEELGVKVTRLRRRLSIESEGTQSPATPSTPTKKRAARLAKPALDLIDENVLENVPKRGTRKSIARDVAELTDEKPVTPSRRSARIRSNTSLIMESTQPVLDSPRARRATRRNSQLGSDTETATTPAKPTRRTRKDSSSSVEKLVLTHPSEKSIAQVTKAITEEPEKEVTKDANKSDDQSPTHKKSPRFNKRGRKSIEEAVKVTHEENAHADKTLTDTAKIELSSLLDNRPAHEASTNTNTDTTNKNELKVSEKENLSLSSTNLISDIDPDPKKPAVLNKTVSAIEGSKIEKYSKKRTKSWTNTQTSERSNLYNKNTIKSSDDSCLKNSSKIDTMSPNKSVKAALTFNSSTENKENMTFLKSMNALDAIDTVKVLGKTPTKDMQSIVFMEDSDSNSGSIDKLTMDIPKDLHSQHDADDQCVPVVHQTSKKSSPSESFSVEPMDIDETIPENVTINDFSDKTNSSREEDNFRDSGQNDSKRKSSLSNENSINVNESPNRSKKTSISLQEDLNNSKRKSSISSFVQNNDHSNAGVITPDNANNFKRKSLISTIESEIGNRDSVTSKGDDIEGTNTFKRQSLLSNTDTKNTKRKLSVNSELTNNGNKANEIANGSKTNSSILNVESETAKLISVSSQAEYNDKFYNTANISKGKPVCEAESLKLESTNENRSTLVLSQFRDTSSNDVSNASKSHNDTDNEISKSVTMPDLDKKPDKKNLSQNYLTSTPLQQKPLQKLTMQINTSNISLNHESKNGQNPKIMKSPNKNVSNVVNNFDTSDNDSDESSKESNMLDDEAIEAGEDYESGDSRSEEDREYEKRHEFVEKGETLDSEEEISNDSDYEKDSFVVTSDEEDNDLLSGSGDDLSFSDNELKMTAKSKKKFDERKRKEQKQASKEMFEARHTLNKSDKSSHSKTKKAKRQRLESSTLDSDEEEETQPKKKNRLRIDSSIDVTTENSNADESIRPKKKKTKRLSESFCEGGNEDPNEKEITIHNQSAPNKNDPLSVSIKLEPKTPQKEFNVSTVQISDAIENVQIDDANASVTEPTRTTDPLQVTLAQEDETSESDISENLEIKANYDNVLENLNRSNKQNTSLNSNKKAKKKVTEVIVDQLNLSLTTKSKKNKEEAIQKNEIITEPSKTKKTSAISPEYDDGEISDSIDMRLLFPEDSNDSESYDSKFRPTNKDVETAEQLIPLKRTEASTNIRESLDVDLPQNEAELNVSITKNKDRQPSDNIPDTTNVPEEKSFSFFIDTKGTYGDMETSTLNSTKKNKQDMSVNEHNETLTGIADNTNAEYTILDVSVMSDKKKKKHKKNATCADTEQDLTLDESQSSKKNTSKSATENVESDNLVADKTNTEHTPLEVSFMSDKKKKKHENKNISKNIEQDIPLDVSHSGKKTPKKASESEAENIQDRKDESVSQLFLHESFKSDKKKKKNKNMNTSVNNVDNLEPTNVSHIGDKTSKNTASNEMENQYPDSICNTEPQESPVKSEKKKKKNKNVDTSINGQDISTVSVSQSGKKKSKKASESALDIETENAVAETTITELSSLNVSNKSDKKKKKNKKGDTSVCNEETSEATDSHSGIQNKSQEITITELSSLNVSNKSDKKNKKNKKGDTVCNEETSEATDTHSGIQNKSQEITIPELSSLNVSNKSDKKKKKNKKGDTSLCNEETSQATDTQSGIQNKSQGKGQDIKTHNEVIGSEIAVNVTPTSAKKKKRNKSMDISQTETTITELLLNVSNKSDKKKKKNKNNDTSVYNEQTSEAVVAEESKTQNGVTGFKITEHATPNSDKKKKKKNKSFDISQTEPVATHDISTDSGKKKKNKKNKNIAQLELGEEGVKPREGVTKPKKRKHDTTLTPPANANDEIKLSSRKQKKPKIPRDDEDDDAPVEERISYIGEVRPCDIETVPEKKFKKKKKKPINKNKVHAQGSEQAGTMNKSKKRKAAEDHDGQQTSKVLKENSFDEVHVSRLPESIIKQLGDKSPKESKKQKKSKAISTVPFEVEEAIKRKNKPSNYLEQSINLNDESPVKQKQKASTKNPKVLPFTPTAITSGKGYTSNFRINMLPESFEFVAQASDVTNFKRDYLSNQRRKKLGTFERCKIHRNIKLSKF